MIPKIPSFNDTHPELLPGEVFFANVASERDQFCGFMTYETKRLGIAAYSSSGMFLEDSRPVFVQRSELVANGLDPDNL